MTRRVWLPLSLVTAGCFAVGVWACRAADRLGRVLADTIGGNK